MSNTPIQEPTAQRLSSGSGQTLPSRPLQPIPEPSASKRVCFYKSGDHKFSGHRMVINARTFKTFEGLLDALSKKVPLPFGVRTITTPRGTHLVKSLDDLQDGESYVCSDQRRVKPLNLDEIKRRQVPWNTTRPLSTGRRRRQQGLPFLRRNDVKNRPARVTERVAVRTPKKLEVIKNKDPTVKRTIVLQRRIAPTFDALLDYLSQILQFPVLKLYSTDGRRVDGLAALILCSGIVVAAGNEPFRLGNYSFHRTGQMAQVMYMETVEPTTLQPRAEINKSFSSGRGSRNFSLSSERYIVNQINKSRNGSTSSPVCQRNGSLETEVNPHHTSVETCEAGRVDTERHSCIVPHEDDIEKSFRVNQDGSMTVEMKVRLTIKEEEMLHWTTTLSRSSLRKGTVCASISESGNSSPNSNNAIAKDSSSTSEDETKEENHSSGAGKAVGFNDGVAHEGRTSAALGKGKRSVKRTPTPGPRYVKKTTSVESVKMVTESGVHENTLGHYSYMERSADGDSTEGYCVITHKSNSNRPIPKPRKTASAGASNKGSYSSIRSTGVAEVLQIENNGMEVTETVMHIYESQGCYDNYVANEEYSTDGAALHDSPAVPDSKPSTVSGTHSSSNDIDFSWKPPTADSLQRQKEEMLSLSSEPIFSTHKIMNDLSSVAENEPSTATNSQPEETVKKGKTGKNEKDKKTAKAARNQKNSTSSSEKKQNSLSLSKNSSNTSAGKKSQSSMESAKNGQRYKGAQKKPEKPLKSKDSNEKTPEKDLVVSKENVKKNQPKTQNMNKAAKDNGPNINTPSGRPQMKKNMSDILQPKKSLLAAKKAVSKPKSMNDLRTPSPKTLEINESVSMPSLNPTPSEIHQYVEDWLEKVSPDQLPYTEETFPNEPQTKVVFQIGGDSETDETSGSHNNVNEYSSYPGDAVKKSASCLSVPLCQEGPATSLLHNEQKSRGLCVSMPSVRVDPVLHDNRLRAHKSAEDIGPADDESSLTNILSPKAKIKPVLRQLCSSIQCIRRVSNTNTVSNLEKSNSLPDFSTQVALVFGSSCKAFLSFLSVMTLRDNLAGSAQGDEQQSRSTSEAVLMMESLQKISTIEDEEEQRASLTDLQSRTSSQFRERWRDFQIFRERLESEPLSPRVSETEFALDVFSESGDAYDDQNLRLNELMDKLNMPEDLRAEISSTIQHARMFYPVEESTMVETEKDLSDSEDDVEQFVKECIDSRKQSPVCQGTCIAGDITEKAQGSSDGERDKLNNMQTLYSEEEKTCESEQAGLYVNESDVSQTQKDDLNQYKDEAGNMEVQVIQDKKGENKTLQVINNVEGEEPKNIEKEKEEEKMYFKETEEEEKEEEGKSEQKETEEVDEVVEMTDEDGNTEEQDSYEEEDVQESENVVKTERGEFTGETSDGEGGNIVEKEEKKDEQEEIAGNDVEEDVEEEEEEDEDQKNTDTVEENEEETMEKNSEGREGGVAEETDEEEEEQSTIHETGEKEEDVGEEVSEDDLGKAGNVAKETDEEEEEQNLIKEKGQKEEEMDVVSEDDADEGEEVGEETDEDEPQSIKEEGQKEEDEDTDEVEEKQNSNNEEGQNKEEEEAGEEGDESSEEDVEEAVKVPEETDEGKKSEEVDGEEGSEDLDQDSEETEKEEDEEGVVGENSDEVDEEESIEDKDIEEGTCDVFQKSSTVIEEIQNHLEEDEEADGEEGKEKRGKMMEEEDDEDDFNEILKEKEESNVDIEERSFTEDEHSFTGDENLLDVTAYVHQQRCVSDVGNTERSGSSTKYSSDVQCEDDKGNGTDTVNELETDEGGDDDAERCRSQSHPVEISQELLDFVNSALQCSSLTFTYDSRGNIRIEPENARVVQSNQLIIPKSSSDNSYGVNCLPSPSTSDLSDYRPETSESGGYKTQESVDVVTESGEEASRKPFPTYRRKNDSAKRKKTLDRPKSKLSVSSKADVLESSGLKSGNTSHESGSKASREDLSYFSAASSLKPEAEGAAEVTQCTPCTSERNPNDGVLIDQGRWLLKENHLIRKSPPVSLGMYNQLDSTSMDTGQENTSEDSPSHYQSQHNTLAAISSSELEEMAKPLTPKCTYYNMPHGSDSDPFLDDSSVKSCKKDSSSFKGRGSKVSPTIDTTKTRVYKNGSLSSFASVEFKIPDTKVHPEGQCQAVTQTRRTSSGGGGVLQAQDSLDTLHLRCSQYCPIL